MYREFFLLGADYLKTLNSRTFLFEWALPLVVASFSVLFISPWDILEAALKFSQTSVTLLGVLVGFSITVITLFTTSDNKNLDEIKNTLTTTMIGGKPITLYKFLLVNLSYSVVIEILGIVVNLVCPFFIGKVWWVLAEILLCINIMMLLHVLLLNIRNLTNFYLVMFKS